MNNTENHLARESSQNETLDTGGWTRRSFVQSLSSLAVGAGMLTPLTWASAKPNLEADPNAKAAESTRVQGQNEKPKPRYRAVSWWLTWDDLTWPSQELTDKVRRRADQCAASGVNCCILFGAHFRWDFMPLWDRLHDLFRFVTAELRQRQIVLFDHHSSVLTHRPRSREEALNIWQRNRHHVPFYPSPETAATWQFNGSRLNDWRMLDVETGQPVYLPAYNAEQFCMNNPAFRDAYVQYVRRLHRETAIDGLMSDDGIFYADWRACNCRYCRQRFRNDYGRRLPPVSDADFWGNRRSKAFHDWIEMRFRTCGDFLVNVQKNLPPGFPLLTCCSSSEGYNLPAYGMSYQDFIRACNHVLLEMCGSTPTIAGTWDDRIPSQLLHLGIARSHQAPCFGLGYGFFPDTAFFIWAVNKFLGSDCWFSTLKGRLDASTSQLAALADDSELVGEGYRWEQAHPHLFTGIVDTDVAVLFSRATRDFYGQVPGDYVADYSASCLELMRAGLSHEVITDIPEFGRVRCLVLSSVTCLSAEQRRRLSQFLEHGGTVIATGPTGHHDERANPVPKAWLQEFGLFVELVEPTRAGGFPPYKHFQDPVALAQCRVPNSAPQQPQDGWFRVAMGQGHLLWRPERLAAKGMAAPVLKLLQARTSTAVQLKGLPAHWRLRQYRDGNRLLIHALPCQVATTLHPTLKNQFNSQRIVERLQFTPLTAELVLESLLPLNRLVLHSPDLSALRPCAGSPGKPWSIAPSGISRYFILECFT